MDKDDILFIFKITLNQSSDLIGIILICKIVDIIDNAAKYYEEGKYQKYLECYGKLKKFSHGGSCDCYLKLYKSKESKLMELI